MEKKTAKILAIILGILAVTILSISWIYPYSTFSIHKSYNYKPDPVVTSGYVEDLNNFKNTYEEISSKDGFNLTVSRTQYILPMFEQDWLINTDSVKMDDLKLEAIEMEVKKVRTLLLQLAFSEEYPADGKEQLGYTLNNVIALGDFINDIQNRKANESRHILHNEYSNLQMNFVSTLMTFVTFYERAVISE
jgi:hypothetical protein